MWDLIKLDWAFYGVIALFQPQIAVSFKVARPVMDSARITFKAAIGPFLLTEAEVSELIFHHFMVGRPAH
jgi:hypothetical protein